VRRRRRERRGAVVVEAVASGGPAEKGPGNVFEPREDGNAVSQGRRERKRHRRPATSRSPCSSASGSSPRKAGRSN
jgi:hypothetical protein